MVRFKIDKILEDNRVSAYWLAQESGITYASIHKIVNNKVKSVNLDTLEKLCKALKCDLPDIMELVKEE